MRKILLVIMIQGVLMGAILNKIKIDGVEVPFIFERDTNLPIISMQIIFNNSGIIYDEVEGLSNLTSKVLGRGTKKDGSIKFAEKLESNAISLYPYVGTETSGFILECLKDNFDYGVELLKDLILDPNYDNKVLDKIKKQIAGTIKRLESNFDYISSLELKKLLFKGTSLAKNDIGTLDSIKNISVENIKNHLKEYAKLDNILIIIGGDITEKQAIEYMKKILILFPNLTSPKTKYIKTAENAKTTKKIVSSQQAYIYFGSPFYLKKTSTETYLATVASFILGSGFGSRLMEEIRVKKGLAYSIYSSINLEKTHNYFSGYLQTKLSSEKEAIDGVKSIINKFVSDGVTEEELTSAKQFIIGSQALRKETLSQRLRIAFNDFYNNHPLGYSDEKIKLIQKLTLSELNSFIKSHKELINLSFSIVTGK